jgi:hypothetical protein
MEQLAENDLTYFYLRHVVIVVTAITTISLQATIEFAIRRLSATYFSLVQNYIIMKIIAGSYIAKMWKEPLSISQEKCVMHYTVFASDQRK